MKKIAQIFLLVIYTAAALGISVKGFYCCDTLRSVSVSLTGTREDNTDTKDGCFKTKYQVLQVKDNHCAPVLSAAPEAVYAEIAPLFYSCIQTIIPGSEPVVTHQSNPPPLLATIPVYLYDCVFRI